MTGYFATNDEIAFRMCAFGIAATIIHWLSLYVAAHLFQLSTK